MAFGHDCRPIIRYDKVYRQSTYHVMKIITWSHGQVDASGQHISEWTKYNVVWPLSSPQFQSITIENISKQRTAGHHGIARIINRTYR